MVFATGSIATHESTAGSVTYNIVDHPSLENGYALSGTITTDGKRGTRQLPT